MILDRWIKRLLPKDDTMYAMLEESTSNLVKAGHVMKKLAVCTTVKQRDEIVKLVKDLEHEGDSITHRLFSELNAKFVTPLDREDIHELASALDDVLDHLNGAAGRFSLYKLKRCPPRMVELIDVISSSIEQLHAGVALLRDLTDYEAMQVVLRKVNEYENEADAIFESAVAELFEKEKDPIAVIKMKEIYVGLETATDMCEDAANVLEGILIKNA